MKPIAYALIALTLAALIFRDWSGGREKEALRAETVAREIAQAHAEDKVRIYRALLDSTTEAETKRAEKAEKKQRAAEAKVAEMAAVIAAAGAAVDSTVQAVHAIAPELADSLAAQIEREREGQRERDAGWRSANEALQVQVEAERARRIATAATLTAETIRADVNAELAESWKARALAAEERSFWDRAKAAVIPVALGVIGGVLLSR